MIVCGTSEAQVIVFFLQENLRDVEILETSYEKNIFHTKEITISESGRIFILEKGKTKLQELQLRQTKVDNNWIREIYLKVFAKDPNVLKLSKTRFSGHYHFGNIRTGISQVLGAVQFKRREITYSKYSFDETKNVLYHLLDYKIKSNFGKEQVKQRVFIYDFGEQDGDFVYRDKISILELRKSINSFTRSILTQSISVEKDYIVDISAIKKFESMSVDLVVILASGIRVFIDFPRGYAGKTFKTEGFRFYDPYRIRSSFGIKFIRLAINNIQQKTKIPSSLSTSKIDTTGIERFKMAPSSVSNKYLSMRSHSVPSETQFIKGPIIQKYHFNTFFVLSNYTSFGNFPFVLARNWRPASALKSGGFSMGIGLPAPNPTECLMVISGNNDEDIIEICPTSPERHFAYYKILPYSVHRKTPWTFNSPNTFFEPSLTNVQGSVQNVPTREQRSNQHLTNLKFVTLNDFAHQIYFSPNTYLVRSVTKLSMHVMLRPVDMCYTYLKAMSLMQIDNLLYHENYLVMPDVLEFFRSIGPLNFCACLIQILTHAESDFFISIPILQNALEKVIFKETRMQNKLQTSTVQKLINDCKTYSSVGTWQTSQKYSKIAHFLLREFAKTKDVPSKHKPEDYLNLLETYTFKEFREPLVVTETPISDGHLIKIIETFTLNFNNYIQLVDRRIGFSAFDGISSIMDNRSFTSADQIITKGLFSSETDKDSSISILQESCFLFMSRILG